MTHQPRDRSHILTEQRNPRSIGLGLCDVESCVSLLAQEDRVVSEAIAKATPSIVEFIRRIEPGFLRGGRLVYIGAGTSGRLGVLDASECPPTFCVPPDRIIGLIAGGDLSLRRSSEGMEDDPLGACPELDALGLGQDDALLGIAAGGTTPYVIGAIEHVKRIGLGMSQRNPITGLLTCTPLRKPSPRDQAPTTPGSRRAVPAGLVSQAVDHLIILETGPEVLTGSTRLKAGSATKMTLNMISTTLMVRAGKVYENLMVDVRATNEKLKDRAARIISTITGVSRDDAFRLLDQANGHAKAAVVMQWLGVDAHAAAEVLASVDGNLHDVRPHRGA